MRSKFLVPLFISMILASCHQLNDERIPSMPVYIDMSNPGVWNAYGTEGYGNFNYFIYTNAIRLPAGFPYTYNSYTGYGGVLLINGQSGFTGDVGPLAYDLSCPVERLPDIRVYIDTNSLEAVCPDCGSHYDVVEAGGAPVSGPAQSMHYALTHYDCYPTNTGGYIISR